MNDMQEIKPDTALATIIEQNPVIVLLEPEKFDAFYAYLEKEVEAFVPDLTTEKGRKAIGSLAYKIARSKTAIDEAGKKLNEDARKKIKVVDLARAQVWDKIEALQTKARKPLTDWEDAEKARKEKVEDELARIRAAGIVSILDNSEDIAETLAGMKAHAIDPDVFQEDAERGQMMLDHTIATLEAALVRVQKEETDRAELERLRKAEDERLEKERLAEEQRLEDERKRQEEEARAQREKEEQEAVERAKKEAADNAARAAEEKAKADQDARDRAHQEEVDRLKKEAEDAQAEADRAAKAEADRKAEVEAEAAAARRRAADVAHRATIMKAAKEALMSHGSIPEDAARAIVLAIARGQIPHVTITF